jgi:hypothetical protein
MEQTSDIQVPVKKVFKIRAIGVGTLIGGPLVAGYLIAENFRAFNDTSKVKKTWIYTIISTIVIFAGVFLIPDSVRFPNQIIPLIYTGIAYYLAHHFQENKISGHINAGGQIFSWGRTIGIALIGLGIMVVAIFVIVFFSDTTVAPTKKTFGNLKHEILFENDNISENEVNLIADGLTKTMFFDELQQKSVFVKKEGEKYIIIIPVIEYGWKDPAGVAQFELLRKDIQTRFPKNKIVMELCAESIDNIKKRLE